MNEVARLKRLLEERDKFIVENGLWMDFVNGLRPTRTLDDVIETIEGGNFYRDYDKSVSDLGILKGASAKTKELEDKLRVAKWEIDYLLEEANL